MREFENGKSGRGDFTQRTQRKSTECTERRKRRELNAETQSAQRRTREDGGGI
jgi:hypothetical protein